MQMTTPTNSPNWLRRVGLAGFLFFLAKGMAWLSLPYLAATFLN